MRLVFSFEKIALYCDYIMLNGKIVVLLHRKSQYSGIMALDVQIYVSCSNMLSV